MTPEDAVSIGAMVTLLTQLTKRLRPTDGEGPYIAAIFSLVAVIFWTISWLSSSSQQPNPSMLYPTFVGWVQVWAISTGLYGTTTMATSTIDRIRAANKKG